VIIIVHWCDAHVPDVTATMIVLFTTAVAPVNEMLLPLTNMLDPVSLPADGAMMRLPTPACIGSLNVSTMSVLMTTPEEP
jgi:hypothetical protein